MLEADYSPFDKRLEDLRVDDLHVLRTTTEGWYVEYKQTLPDLASIAKSISSFANQYGGWLFLGVQEEQRSKVAESFPGIPTEMREQVDQRINDAVASHIQPLPLFAHRVLGGPSTNLELPEDRSIWITRVFQGAFPPYVHSSGKIYRRVGNQSQARAEADRGALDILCQRGQRSSERLKSMFARAHTYADQGVATLQLLFAIDPFGVQTILPSLSFREAAALAREDSVSSGGLGFENIFSSARGLVACVCSSWTH